jgi:hypothetical protein
MDTILRWEYKVETLGSAFSTPKDEEIEETLNEWGEQGWEIISVFQSSSGSPKIRIVAKRPLSERERRRRSMPV